MGLKLRVMREPLLGPPVLCSEHGGTCGGFSRTMQYLDGTSPQPGDAWYIDSDNLRGCRLSTNYEKDWRGKRPPIMVVLPTGTWHCVDSAYTSSADGWAVTGSLEEGTLTATPSIHYVGIWHGHLRNSELTPA